MDKYINVKDINFQWLPLSTLTDEFVTKTQINNIPAADVEPVRHGHWFFTEYEYFTCSHCLRSYYNSSDSSHETRERLKNGDFYEYCPHCGAKMDEVIGE